MDCSPPGSSLHGISQARKRVGCHFLLQGIFWTQGLNPHLLHWQADSFFFFNIHIIYISQFSWQMNIIQEHTVNTDKKKHTKCFKWCTTKSSSLKNACELLLNANSKFNTHLNSNKNIIFYGSWQADSLPLSHQGSLKGDYLMTVSSNH